MLCDHSLPIKTKTVDADGVTLRYDLYRGVLCRDGICISSYSIGIVESSLDSTYTCLLYDAAPELCEAENMLCSLCDAMVSPLHASDLFYEL